VSDLISSSLLLFCLGMAGLFSLLYLSSFVGVQMPLVSHLKPKLSSQQALDAAESYLRSQIGNITTIRTEQQVRASGPDPSSAKIPIFLGFYDGENKTFYKLNSTDYTMIGQCNQCIVGTEEFKNEFDGRMFYVVELYVTKGMSTRYYPVFVDAMTGDILYPKDMQTPRSGMNGVLNNTSPSS
jgi:hypothetical protein